LERVSRFFPGALLNCEIKVALEFLSHDRLGVMLEVWFG
jgi:hypothetical protein